MKRPIYLTSILLFLTLGISHASALPKCVGSWSTSTWSNCFGTYTWASGDKYVGEWQNGQAHGLGSLTWTSGQKYVGEFVLGYHHGQGTHTYADGSEHQGIFNNDNVVNFRYEASLDLRQMIIKQKANLSGTDQRVVNQRSLRAGRRWEGDLSRANLGEAGKWVKNQLSAHQWRTDLRRTNLSEEELWRANRWRANLSEAELWKADRWRADLIQTDRRVADLIQADVSGPDLIAANYTRARLIQEVE